MHSPQNQHAQLTGKDKKLRIWASVISVLVSFFVTGLKLYAFSVTNSQGVYSDAIESIVNIFTALFAMFVVYYASKPVDDDHPYGHGKIEYFSAAFEGGLITAAALLILYQAGEAFYLGHSLGDLGSGTLYLVIAGAINIVLGLFLIRSGKKYNSMALTGSGQHVLSDVWTSVAIVAGLIFIQFTGLIFIDLVLAAAAGLYLLYVGYKLIRSSIAGLLDEEDMETLEDLQDAFKNAVFPGIIQLHHVKVIRSGWFHHIDAHVVMPEFWTVTQAHDQLNKFEEQVIKNYPYKGEMNFHTDPCEKKYCQFCDLSDCEIRKEDFKERRPILLKDLRSTTEPEV